MRDRESVTYMHSPSQRINEGTATEFVFTGRILNSRYVGSTEGIRPKRHSAAYCCVTQIHGGSRDTLENFICMAQPTNASSSLGMGEAEDGETPGTGDSAPQAWAVTWAQ